MVFNQDEIERVALDHFKERFDGPDTTTPANDNPPPSSPDLRCRQFKEDEFEEYVCSPYSFAELEDMLDRLPNNKAAGTDNIPNELLKNTSLVSRLYIQSLVNQILVQGEVPEELSNGKCVLIYKVLYNELVIDN